MTSVKSENKKLELLKSRDGDFIIFKNQKKPNLPLSVKDSLRIYEFLRTNNKNKDSPDEILAILEKTIQYEVDSLNIQRKDSIFEIN